MTTGKPPMLYAHSIADDGPTPCDTIVLAHDERHLRRKSLQTTGGETVLVDLPAPVRLRGQKRLVLTDGRHIGIVEADEALYAISAATPAAMARIAWHIGNRHARAQIDGTTILIARDHVLRDMLIGLGVDVQDVSRPFEPDQPMLHGIPHHHAHD